VAAFAGTTITMTPLLLDRVEATQRIRPNKCVFPLKDAEIAPNSRWATSHAMTAQTLNTIGLLLNIAGVILVFFYGFPQPTHEEGAGRGLEDGTAMPDGRTVAQHNEDIRKTKARYLCMSRLALGLIILGFLFQLWATWK
jgi:hypothetical protein